MSKATGKIIQDPGLYARMAEPYASQEEAAKALATFFTRLDALREECRIPELVIAAAAHLIDPEGDTSSLLQMHARGDSKAHEMMGARIYRHFTRRALDHAEALERAARAETAETRAKEEAHLRQLVTDERDSVRATARLVTAGRDAVWFWQGGGDHPESLSCPVVMSAETLRTLLAAEARVNELEALVEASRKFVFWSEGRQQLHGAATYTEGDYWIVWSEPPLPPEPDGPKTYARDAAIAEARRRASTPKEGT